MHESAIVLLAYHDFSIEVFATLGFHIFESAHLFVASQSHQIQCDKLIYEEISLFH